MTITINELQDADAKALFEFEIENRDYFEEMVPGRGDAFYDYEIFKSKLQSLLAEQARGESTFYLIKNQVGVILGRINLVDIDRSMRSGHIGYRVGRVHTGRGVAFRALELLTEKLQNKGMKELFAKTTTNNVASQKVLVKNGFHEEHTSEEEFSLNGHKYKFVHFSWVSVR